MPRKPNVPESVTAAAPAAPQLRSLSWVAAKLGLSYWSVRDLCLRGALPAVRLPGKRGGALRRILIDERDLARFIDAHRTAAA